MLARITDACHFDTMIDPTIATGSRVRPAPLARKDLDQYRDATWGLIGGQISVDALLEFCDPSGIVGLNRFDAAMMYWSSNFLGASSINFATAILSVTYPIFLIPTLVGLFGNVYVYRKYYQRNLVADLLFSCVFCFFLYPLIGKIVNKIFNGVKSLFGSKDIDDDRS